MFVFFKIWFFKSLVDEFSEEAQLRLAIHLSLEESRRGAGDAHFLKSLTKHELKNLNLNVEPSQDAKSSKTLFGNVFVVHLFLSYFHFID